ncbi:HEPN domain-containing protein [Parabacteroides faecis]|uniref:HEPN domain-containing protein n=1 Tax=Parabacteroides faecis TaxID=1217282 RepID=UPI00351FF501
MTDDERTALIALRLQNAKDTLQEITVHIEHGFWNTATNRMYYACYYAVAALLLKKGISVKTHSGVRQAFGKEFVASGQVSKEQARFFSILYDNRQTGDYDDYIMMTRDKVEELYPQAIVFIDSLEKLILE